jgi:hypothetical protein
MAQYQNTLGAILFLFFLAQYYFSKDRGLNKTQRLKSRLQEQNLPTQVEIRS